MSATKQKLGSMMIKIMAWYQKLDHETIELTVRVFSKGIATGDMNAYVKSMLRRELGEKEASNNVPGVIEVAHEDSVPSTQR